MNVSGLLSYCQDADLMFDLNLYIIFLTHEDDCGWIPQPNAWPPCSDSIIHHTTIFGQCNNSGNTAPWYFYLTYFIHWYTS